MFFSILSLVQAGIIFRMDYNNTENLPIILYKETSV
jgi:hypothetical protein